MKLHLKVLLAAILAVPTLMAAQTPDTRPAPLTVSLDGVDLKDVGSDRAHFQVRSHITAARKLKVKDISFSHMRLGGVPIYLGPIEEHLQLDKGVSVNLPSVPVTVYFRDLDSTEPLAQAIRDGHTTVTGEVRAHLELSLIDRIAMRDLGPRATLPIDLTIPVTVPGGSTGKTAALAGLRAAQIALSVGGSALGRLREKQKTWDSELRTRFEPALLVTEARYSLRTKDGQQVDFNVRGMGFRISDDKFVVTGEMIEPWQYDPDAAAVLKANDATLLRENFGLRARRSIPTRRARSCTGRLSSSISRRRAKTPIPAWTESAPRSRFSSAIPTSIMRSCVSPSRKIREPRSPAVRRCLVRRIGTGSRCSAPTMPASWNWCPSRRTPRTDASCSTIPSTTAPSVPC